MNEEKNKPWRREIKEGEFFYVQEDSYDDNVENAIPLYKEMHAELKRVLTSKPNPPDWVVLDLGVGTGKTSQVILDSFKVSRLDAIDLFNVMEIRARQRLAPYLDRIRFLHGDFMDLPFEGPYDVCVSSLAVHHQLPEGKQALFQKIYNSMTNDGVFVLIDWTNFHSSMCNKLSFNSAHENVIAKVPDPTAALKWSEHWKTKNIPSSVEDQVKWMKEAGFESVEVPIRFWGMTMICAWVRNSGEVEGE